MIKDFDELQKVIREKGRPEEGYFFKGWIKTSFSYIEKHKVMVTAWQEYALATTNNCKLVLTFTKKFLEEYAAYSFTDEDYWKIQEFLHK